MGKANKFVLKHRQIEVDYTLGMNPSFVALTYRDESGERGFKPGEIQTDETPLGSLVSVTLQETKPPEVGGGRETFGFFLAEPDLAMGESVGFITAGVYGAFTIGADPSAAPSWRSIELHGTAESVAVPLVQPVTP